MRVAKQKDGTILIEGLLFDDKGRKTSADKGVIHIEEKSKVKIDGEILTVVVMGYSNK